MAGGFLRRGVEESASFAGPRHCYGRWATKVTSSPPRVYGVEVLKEGLGNADGHLRRQVRRTRYKYL